MTRIPVSLPGPWPSWARCYGSGHDTPRRPGPQYPLPTKCRWPGTRAGNYLTLNPVVIASFIAHGTRVQVMIRQAGGGGRIADTPGVMGSRSLLTSARLHQRRALGSSSSLI